MILKKKSADNKIMQNYPKSTIWSKQKKACIKGTDICGRNSFVLHILPVVCIMVGFEATNMVIK